MARHELWELKQMQSLPLQAKIQMTRQRIRAWIDEFGEDGVYVSFSGGKDSTVLLDIVRKDYPSIEAVFVNTGLEYPSVRQFALSKENVTELRPTMNFRDVIIKYGYPIISKEVSQTLCEARNSKNNGKWNRNWMCFLYEIEGYDGCYCSDCVEKIKENYKKRGAVMRLIDADNFMEYLGFDNTDEEREENVGQIVTLEDFDRQETAYDVDKVVKSINEIGKRYCDSIKCNKNCEDCEHGCLMRVITNAVKSGGVSND